MRILVVGGGSREDALSWRLAQSPSCTAVFAAPGNAGTALHGENWPLAATQGKALVERAQLEKIDLVVVGPETAIAAGVSDRFREAGIPVFGPSRSAGRLESSKVFSKRFMERHGIPTPRARVVHMLAAARKELAAWHGPCVIKADGLAAGKGVVVADSANEGLAVLERWFNSGIPGGGSDVLIEEKVEGREVSVFAIGDGKTLVPLASACDYKRAGDGDTGPNTGGMGAYSPARGFPDDMYGIVEREILAPVLQGLREEGESFVGILYCGLMWTKKGPKVIEFNVRFGDPETQVLMPRVRGDLAKLLHSAAIGKLDSAAATFDGDPCVGVVLATREYPGTSTPVAGLPKELGLPASSVAFWGNSTLRDGCVDAAGGRVLTVTSTGADLPAARKGAYAALAELGKRIERTGLTYRSDIASDIQ